MGKKPEIHKIGIMGDGACGKSSLIAAKMERDFDTSKSITIGVDFEFIPLEASNPEEGIKQFLAMDLGGQDRFRPVQDAYIKGIKGALIVFDLSRYRSFSNMLAWIEMVIKENVEIPILLVGNKVDLIDHEQVDQYEEDLIAFYEQYKDECNLYGYILTSAKNGFNVKETFAICEEMILLEEKSSREILQKNFQSLLA
ncbi:MAG: Rab family GTPase [Promethearchaeota archaeon]